jgi:patatin-like phospholipase/acyl hydrolase
VSPEPERDRFRILVIDGGGIRGLIAARVIERLEAMVSERAGAERRVADCFHMLCGTSTGGLLALGLTVPDPDRPGRPKLSGERLKDLYLSEGPEIFGDRLHKLLSLGGWIAPKHSPGGLEEALRERFGETRLRDALRELIVTAYDMHEPGPHFFKRWRARDDEHRDASMVDVGMATSSAPTYFPSHQVDERVLVDGGVFAANPVVAAVTEALKRRDDAPASVSPQELLVVSLGTGQYEVGFEQRQVRRWGRIGWVWPSGGEPALISTFLDGQSDAAHHWADVLLNHEPGRAVLKPARMGTGPHYYRFQIRLPRGLSLDDASPGSLAELGEAADRLVAEREPELAEVADRLAALEPLAPDPA